jgi:hypothetical protein
MTLSSNTRRTSASSSRESSSKAYSL